VEHHRADLKEVAGCVTSPDDAARFLRELRELRDGAGLGQAELAARAHYPHELIQAAEAGPTLPDLPVLSAFVRGCGGTVEEWEERWRSLTKSPALSTLPTRDAGNSPAADAGARIGSAAPITDADPSAIIAALGRVAEEMSGSKAATLPASSTASGMSQASAEGSASAAAPAPSASSAAAPAAVPAVEPAAGSLFERNSSAKPAGWDPIRVSTAWPALRDTDLPNRLTAEPERAPQTGPWGTARESVTVAPAAVVAPGSQPRDGTARAARVRIMVAAAVLLCVIVAVLAIFA
jgi:hypothetical protein